MTLRKPFLLICIAQFWLCPYANSIELWKERRNLASSFESKHNYLKAAETYQAALKLVPGSEENAKAKIEAAIALNLITAEKYDDAFSYGEAAARASRVLKMQNRLDPDVLLSLQYLLEACDAVRIPLSVPYKRRHTLNQKFTKLTLLMRQAINPDDPSIYNRRIGYARTFVALQNDDQAEKELSQILGELSSKSKLRRQVQLAIAGLQAKHGRKSKFEIDFLRTHKPESEALRKVADGKLWAGDYAGARALLDQAMTRLSGTKAEKLHQEVDINLAYASLKIDNADWKGAEPFIRHSVALLSKDPKDTEKLNGVKFQLATCLKEQKRFKEAEALQPPKPDRNKYVERYNFILTDEEKAELAKVQNKKKNGFK